MTNTLRVKIDGLGVTDYVNSATISSSRGLVSKGYDITLRGALLVVGECGVLAIGDDDIDKLAQLHLEGMLS